MCCDGVATGFFMPTVGGAGLTKAAMALTHRAIESLRLEAIPYRVPDSRCSGLALRVATSGSKTFDLSFRIKGGLARRMSLGRFPEISLEEARDRANELTKVGRAGRDLVSEERASAAESARRITVSDLIEQYASRELRGKLKTAKEN